MWGGTHQPSPSPLEMSKTYPPPFGFVVWAFVLLHCVCHRCSSPLVRFSSPLCLLCAGCKSARSASTIDITFGGEQDLRPTPLWSYYSRVCVVALCSPSLQLPLGVILLPPCQVYVQVAWTQKGVCQSLPSPLEVSKTWPPFFGLVVCVFMLLHCVCHCYSSPFGSILLPLCCLLYPSHMNTLSASNVQQ